MVVFTCNLCGDSIQKPKVEKHITIECKKKFMNPSLCCVDCLKDFDRQSYGEHTKCVTELERYSGKGFVPKASSNKGEKKQQSWVEVIHAVLQQPNLSASQRALLKPLSNYCNVPRKHKKFKNFVLCSLKHLRMHFDVIDEVFNLIDTEFKSMQSNATNDKETKKDSPTESNEQPKAENTEKDSSPDETPSNNEAKKKQKKNKSKDSENSNTSIEPQSENTVETTDPQPESNSQLDESASFEVVKKKKKSKKKSNTDAENENTENEKIQSNENANDNRKRSFGNNFEEDIPSKDLSKKKQKKLKIQEPAADISQTPIATTELEASENVTEQAEENAEVFEEENLQKLSKKEKKELKKRLKYEAQLKAIESEAKNTKNDQLPDDNQENDAEKNNDEKTAKKEKRKKRKLTESNENQKLVIKKSKTSETEPLNQEIEQVNGDNKFSWEEVIRNVLEKAEGHEISLKKLTKKAVAEYQACHSDQKTYEEVLKKFNKKITKLPFVKILKDKAKLCA